MFLLPSAQESFGLAALEAMACEVPVVASRVGGLPEVIEDGVSGFLHAPDDLDGMAHSALRLLTDDALHRRVAEAACRTAHERFCDVSIVPMYEAYYEEVLARPRAEITHNGSTKRRVCLYLFLGVLQNIPQQKKIYFIKKKNLKKN